MSQSLFGKHVVLVMREKKTLLLDCLHKRSDRGSTVLAASILLNVQEDSALGLICIEGQILTHFWHYFEQLS